MEQVVVEKSAREILLEGMNQLECPFCHRILAITTENFFIKVGETKPYWQGPQLRNLGKSTIGCKACYKEYRKALRLKKKEKGIPISQLNIDRIESTLTKASEKGFSRWKEDFNKFFKEELSILGCKYIGSGIDRIAFSLGKDYIVKIGFYDDDEQQKMEVKNWKKISKLPESLRKYFIPILAYDKKHYNWIIMPRAKVEDSKDITRDEACEIEDKLRRIFEKNNIHYQDLHYGNVGLYKGIPVMVDLGFKFDFEGEKNAN
jgi:hypothetical protein